MTENEILERFGVWVESLPEDTSALRAAYESKDVSKESKKILVGGLAYLLRKIDIVPDYLGGLGSVDDAMVLREIARLAMESGLADFPDDEKMGVIVNMANETSVVQEFLGELYEAFVAYVKTLPAMKVRNRDADMVLDDSEAGEQFGYELDDELKSYKTRSIDGGEKALRELKSFIKAKVNR